MKQFRQRLIYKRLEGKLSREWETFLFQFVLYRNACLYFRVFR